jgi:hypothetical protein
LLYRLQLFRNLTQTGGVLIESAEQIEAYLLPTVNYPPALQKIVRGLLTEINARDPKMPDGSGRPGGMTPEETSS